MESVLAVTVIIELLSPTNKRESWERQRYQTKRRNFTSAGVNLVEIDLVRQGVCVFPDPVRAAFVRSKGSYAVCVFRAAAGSDYALYPIQFRERLPVIRVPLRPADVDVLIDLQPLIDQCHERGRYHRLDYQAPLVPPLADEDSE